MSFIFKNLLFYISIPFLMGISTVAEAQDAIPVSEGEIVPFSGTLLTSEAAASLLAEIHTCAERSSTMLQFELDSTIAKCELDISLSAINLESSTQRYQSIILSQDEQLEYLLMRDDIRAEEFRKELFWRDEIPNDNEDEFMPYREFWSQASLYHFKLNEEEFARILSLPPKEQQKRLESLSQAHSLELYQYLAIIQLVTKFDKDSYDNFYINFAEDELKKRLNQEPEFFRDEQLIKLRLYDLAYASRNWRNPDDLYSCEEILYPVKVEDDTWKTFLAFIVAFKESELTLKDLLPTEYEGWEEEEEEKPLEKPLASELSQLNSLISTTRDAAFQNRLALAVIAGLVLISVIF